MDLENAKYILRLIANDKSQSGRAWDKQEICAKVILKELQRLERVEKDFQLIKNSLDNAGITVEVSGGMVQNVYTTIKSPVAVDILDFDDNGTRSDDEHEDLLNHLRKVAGEQQQIY